MTTDVPPRVLIIQQSLYGRHAWRATICDYTITERQRYYKHGHSADGATSADAIAALIMIDGRAADVTPEITRLVLSSEPTNGGAIPVVVAVPDANALPDLDPEQHDYCGSCATDLRVLEDKARSLGIETKETAT